MTAIRINGTDIGTTFGWYPDDVPQWLTAPVRSLTTSALYGRTGAVVSGAFYGTPRSLGIAGTVTATSVTNRRAAEAGIFDLCYGGLVTISVEDGLTSPRTIKGYCTTLDVTPFGLSMAPLAVRVSAAFVCPDPTWYDQEPTSRVLSTTRATLPLGTAPSTGLVRVMGSATTPQLIYRNAAGTAIKTLTTGQSLTASNDWFDIDMRTGKITRWLSGTSDNFLQAAANSVGDFPFAFDPQDGDYTTSAWPTLELSSGTGVAYWWKAYQ